MSKSPLRLVALLANALLLFLAGACDSSGSATAPPEPAPTPTPTPSATYPASCQELRSQILSETGSSPANGTYTLYVNGDQNSPWEAFCYQMDGDSPVEYLTVLESNNFSQVGNGTHVAVTSYRRFRIDPTSLEINPLDNTFATNSGFEDFTPELPDGLTYIPAGWAEFQPTRSDDGPAAEGQADLTGTAFVFSQSILANNLGGFFCQVSSDGTNPEDTDGTGASVAADLSSFLLTAINSNPGNQATGVWTREVADCANLGGSSFTSASWPLQYAGR